MGRRGVYDARLRSFSQGHRLARGLVGQAEDREIGGVEGVAPRLGRLAAGLVENEQFELVPAREPIEDLEPGGSGSAVDEDRRGHDGSPVSRARGT